MTIEALDLLKEGAQVTILNALAKISNKFIKVNIDQWARVSSPAPDVAPIEGVNQENNISAVEYALVEKVKKDKKKGDKRGGKGDRKDKKKDKYGEKVEEEK